MANYGSVVAKQILANGVGEWPDQASFITNVLRIVAVPQGTKDPKKFVDRVLTDAMREYTAAKQAA